MKKVLVVLITDHAIEENCFQAIRHQDYENYSSLIHIQRPVLEHPNPTIKKSLNCSHNRNVARKLALASDAESFLFVDSDIVIQPDCISRLVAIDLPIVGGWYPMVTGPLWVAGKHVGLECISVAFAPAYGQLLKMDMIGMGCALLSREVLEKIEFDAAVDRTIYCQSRGSRVLMGECYAFGARAKEEGYDMYIDGNVICDHLKRST